MYTYSAASLLHNRRGTRDRSAQAKRAREARETQRQFEVSARNYQCVRIVGKGAYGVVCEAIDRKARSRKEERVAIKKIKEALFHPLDAKLVLRELKLSRGRQEPTRLAVACRGPTRRSLAPRLARHHTSGWAGI